MQIFIFLLGKYFKIIKRFRKIQLLCSIIWHQHHQYQFLEPLSIIIPKKKKRKKKKKKERNSYNKNYVKI